MNIDAWLSASGGAIDIGRRAALAWRRIQRDPDSVQFKTQAGALLDAQTVRIEASESVSVRQGPSGVGAVRQVTVFGVRDHATIDDTDVQEGYRFVLEGVEYRVIDLVLPPGEVQARCEVTS